MIYLNIGYSLFVLTLVIVLTKTKTKTKTKTMLYYKQKLSKLESSVELTKLENENRRNRLEVHP